MLKYCSHQSTNPAIMSVSPSTPTPSTSQVLTTTTEGRTAKTPSQEEASVRLKLRKPKSKKKVVWSANTIDNENMNKRKSKCCCVFEKPRDFGESSSDSEDECEHCRGHGTKKRELPSVNPEIPESGADSQENNAPSKTS